MLFFAPHSLAQKRRVRALIILRSKNYVEHEYIYVIAIEAVTICISDGIYSIRICYCNKSCNLMQNKCVFAFQIAQLFQALPFLSRSPPLPTLHISTTKVCGPTTTMTRPPSFCFLPSSIMMCVLASSSAPPPIGIGSANVTTMQIKQRRLRMRGLIAIDPAYSRSTSYSS